MRFAVILLLMTACPLLQAADGPSTGYWSLAQAREVLDKTRHVYIDPNLGGLTAGEREAVDKLIAAGQLLHEMYLDSLHPEALSADRVLSAREPRGSADGGAGTSCSICSGAR